MTYSINEGNTDRTRNFGGQGGALVEIDVTSYAAGGEDVSDSALGLKRTPSHLHPTVDGDRFGAAWDRANDKLEITENKGATTEFYPDANGASSSDQTSDSASAPAGEGDVLDNEAVPTSSGGSKSVTSGLTDPDFPRSVAISLHNTDTGSAHTLNAAEVVVQGTNQYGESISETFDLDGSGNDITGSIAADNHRWIVGSKVFATVTQVDFNNDSGTSQNSNFEFHVNSGTKFGLQHPIDANGDVNRGQKNSGTLSSLSGDASNNAFDAGEDLSDNDDVQVQYDASGEAPPSTNVGLVQLLVYY